MGQKKLYTTGKLTIKTTRKPILEENNISVILTKGDNIGKRMVMVAGLLATSVKLVTIKEDIRIISQIGKEPKGDNLLPIQVDSPDA